MTLKIAASGPGYSDIPLRSKRYSGPDSYREGTDKKSKLTLSFFIFEIALLDLLFILIISMSTVIENIFLF